MKTLTGKSILVMAKTVAELKSEIMEKQGLSSTDSFRLIYDGKLLEDTNELGKHILYMIMHLHDLVIVAKVVKSFGN